MAGSILQGCGFRLWGILQNMHMGTIRGYDYELLRPLYSLHYSLDIFKHPRQETSKARSQALRILFFCFFGSVVN